MFLHWLVEPTSGAWAAMAAWVTAAIAGAGGLFAYQQVGEARKTRERVAQPNVVVFIDHNPKNWQFLDLVIKNFGQTPAYNIKLTLPPLDVARTDRATGKTVSTLYVPTNIAVLAPGQDWRTVWDFAVRREQHKGELCSQFVGDVEFDDKMIPDTGDKRYRNPISLDINMFRNLLRLSETEPAKLIADQITEVADTLKSYNNEHDGVWVYTVPGEDERRYRDEQRRAHREAQEHLYQQLTRDAPPDEPRRRV